MSRNILEILIVSKFIKVFVARDYEMYYISNINNNGNND